MADQWKIEFLKMPTAILERTDLTASAKLVYAAIRDHFGHKAIAWPGVRRLARKLGTSKNAVSLAITALENTGLLVVERTGESGKSNRYRLPESVHESGTDVHEKRPRNGDGPNRPTVHESCTGVHETGTVASTNRGQNQTDPITRPSKTHTCVSADLAEKLYQAFPKRVGKKAAVEQIRKAIWRVAQGADGDIQAATAWLTERVKQYAASRKDADPRYTKHPERWFRDERYNDDFTESGRSTGHTSAAAQRRADRRRREFPEPDARPLPKL